jgi:hypothetical protein
MRTAYERIPASQLLDDLLHADQVVSVYLTRQRFDRLLMQAIEGCERVGSCLVPIAECQSMLESDSGPAVEIDGQRFRKLAIQATMAFD